VKNVKLEEYKLLCKECGLNINRIEKLCYCSKITYSNCMVEEHEFLLSNAIRQIATNLTYIIKDFNKHSTMDVVMLMKKNCIKSSYYKEFNSRNYDFIAKKLEGNRKLLLMNLLYVYNRIFQLLN